MGLYDRIVNTGGSIGRFFGTTLGTFNKHIIKVETFGQLVSAINSNNGDVWGAVIFGHGGPNGYLEGIRREVYGVDFGNQQTVINGFARQGFEAAKVRAMQCFSSTRTLRNDWKPKWEEVVIDFSGYSRLNVLGINW